MKTAVLRRSELYRQVWERTLTALGTKMGISDTSLKKSCIRHDVPRPPPGFFLLQYRQDLAGQKSRSRNVKLSPTRKFYFLDPYFSGGTAHRHTSFLLSTRHPLNVPKQIESHIRRLPKTRLIYLPSLSAKSVLDYSTDY
jgi:hypothetical protein